MDNVEEVDSSPERENEDMMDNTSSVKNEK